MGSREIAADLRRRIESGELAPGRRVPSTREITRQWGVAMATATKALTELRHDGLVRAVPGVGTIVAGPQPTLPRSARGDLTPERIVDAAIAVADAEGLAAVSMRRVATELGAAPMALYRHVADKDDLLLHMMDAVMAGWRMPAEPPAGWRERLELAARTLWRLFRAHPWLATAMSMTRPQPIPNAIPYTEWTLQTLHTQGADMQTTFTAHLALLNYVRGTAVNLEPEAEAQARTGMTNEEWMDTQEPALARIIGTGRFPLLQQVVSGGYDYDMDQLFEFGLQTLLDGLAAHLDRE